MTSLYIALVHYPVLNRKGEVVASAVTSMDLHDLGRSCCTYDVPVCYIVTPLEDQQDLSRTLIDHWCEGVGRELQCDRAEALRRLEVVESIAEAVEDIRVRSGREPGIWATTAREREDALTHREARMVLAEGSRPHLLLFGTAWGLAPSVFDQVDGVLEAIRGVNGYNHLSVRCAAAILMDRLLGAGERDENGRQVRLLPV